MKKNYVFVNLLILLGFSGCNINPTEQKGTNYINIGKAKFSDTLDLTDYFSSYNLIHLETNNESVLGSISKLKIYDNRIYVLCRDGEAGLFVFNLKGDYLHKISAIGDGPGEFQMISDFTLDTINNKIIILDMGRQLVNIFDRNGKYINTKALPIGALRIEMVGENLFLHPQKVSNDENGFFLHLWNFDSIKSHFFEYQHNSNGNFSIGHRISAFKESITFWEPFNDTIYHINNKLKEHKTFVDFGRRRIDPGIYQMDLSDKIKYVQEVRDKFLFVNDVIETPNSIYFTFLSKNGKMNCFFTKSNQTVRVGKYIKVLGDQKLDNIFGIASEDYAFSILTTLNSSVKLEGRNALDNPSILLLKMDHEF